MIFFMFSVVIFLPSNYLAILHFICLFYLFYNKPFILHLVHFVIMLLAAAIDLFIIQPFLTN